MGCFNCDDPNHMVRNFPKRENISKAAQKRMYYMRNITGHTRNSHIILFEFSQKLQSSESFLQWGERYSCDDSEEVVLTHQMPVICYHNFILSCLDTSAQRSVVDREQAEAY